MRLNFFADREKKPKSKQIDLDLIKKALHFLKGQTLDNDKLLDHKLHEKIKKNM